MLNGICSKQYSILFIFKVLFLRGIISRKSPWDIMPDLYFYRNPEDIEKEEQAAAAAAAKPEETYPQSDWVSSAPEVQQGASTDWGEQPATTTTDVSCFKDFCYFNFFLF